ncbi:MAG: glutathione S-transferase N-terminal domain-containing protein [Methylocystaceae bacterium]|nr:glutathione S-transferase N-terminal domain-containing protein [Methylocystaceae bacterium]
MMEFYMTPGSCSTGIHILLEELEQVFAANIINMPKGDHLTTEYKAINPKGTIPALKLDSGDVLTDFSAIAWWLASRHPKKRLLPQNQVDQARCLEIMNFVTSTLHGQGYTRIFAPEKYMLRDDDLGQVKAKGLERVKSSFDVVAQYLTGCDGLVFDHLTIADAALFYVEFWADRSDIQMPVVCEQHYQTMCTRPIVQQVLAEEGYRLNQGAQSL